MFDQEVQIIRAEIKRIDTQFHHHLETLPKDLKEAASPERWTRYHPYGTIAAALVGGFIAAWEIDKLTSPEERKARRKKKLREQRKTKGAGSKQSGLGTSLLDSAIDLLKTFVKANLYSQAVGSQTSANQTASAQDTVLH